MADLLGSALPFKLFLYIFVPMLEEALNLYQKLGVLSSSFLMRRLKVNRERSSQLLDLVYQKKGGRAFVQEDVIYLLKSTCCDQH